MRLSGLILLGIILAAPAGGVEPQRATSITFSGKVVRGEMFFHPINDSLTFVLEPIAHGWQIVVREAGRPQENLARLTGPYHFVPNPRFLEGWHFRNADNTGPNDVGDKNVNAPGKERRFIFSRRVGRDIDYPPTQKTLSLMEQFSEGRLIVESMTLGNLIPNTRAWFEAITFSVAIELRE